MKVISIKQLYFRFAVVLFIILSSAGSAQSLPIQQVESAVLAEDWGKILETLDVSKDQQLPTSLRLIYGHACLAKNKNNQSLCFFLSISSDNDLRKWEQWTKSFKDRNPKHPISHYFYGDSLARLRQWDEALKEFNTALEICPDHPLILNARGVVYACRKQWHKARVDFNDANNQSDNPLADAYANIGALRIQEKDGAEGALKAFNHALDISPGFALALHGRGCVELILNHPKEAGEAFINAEKNKGCAARLITENLLNIQAYMNGMEKGELMAMIKGEKLSTSLKKVFSEADRYINNPNMANMRNLVKHTEQLSTFDQNRVYDYMNKKIGKDMDMATNLIANGSRGVKWHSDGNPIREIFKWLPNNLNVLGSGGGTDGFNHLITHQNNRRKIYERFQGIGNQIIENTLGKDRSHGYIDGVLASFAGATWDEGEWPFEAYYGLLYPMKSNKDNKNN